METETPEVSEPIEKIRDERDQLHSIIHEFVEEIRKLRKENETLKEKLEDKDLCCG
jgi:regulator of replication initiation timing